MVDLSGRVCSKVGVSYTGFRNQPGKCNREAHSLVLIQNRITNTNHMFCSRCFTNQPLDLWNHDTVMEYIYPSDK